LLDQLDATIMIY